MPSNNILNKVFMSIKQKIKRFLSNIWDLFRQWYEVAEDAIKDNIHVAVVVTENFKKFVDNPIGDFFLSIIDEKVPGNLREKVKEILPKVLITLNIIDQCKDLEEETLLICISEQLKVASKDVQNTFYHSLSVLLAEKLSDGELSFSDVIALVEWYYRNHVKK